MEKQLEKKKALSFDDKTGEIKILLIPTEENMWVGDVYSSVRLHLNFIEEIYKGEQIFFIPEQDEKGDIRLTEDTDKLTIDVSTTWPYNQITHVDRVYYDHMDGKDKAFWRVNLYTVGGISEFQWDFKKEEDANSLMKSLRSWIFFQDQMKRAPENGKQPGASKPKLKIIT